MQTEGKRILPEGCRILYSKESKYVLGTWAADITTALQQVAEDALWDAEEQDDDRAIEEAVKVACAADPELKIPEDDPWALWNIVHEGLIDDHETLVQIAEECGAYIEPVFAHIHSGVILSTSRIPDPWDSGQSGWFIAMPHAVRRLEEFGYSMDQVVREGIIAMNRYLAGEDCDG